MLVVVLLFSFGFVQSFLRSPLIVARAPSRRSMAPCSTDVRSRLALTKLQSFEDKAVDMITGAVQNPANIPSAFIVTWFLGAVGWKSVMDMSAKNQKEMKDITGDLRGDISYIGRRLDSLVFFVAFGVLVLALTVAMLRPALAGGAFPSL